jgi:hypothetical protein
MQAPTIIKDASTIKESPRRVMDGIVNSAMMTSFQRQAIDGVIKSAMPEKSPEAKMLQTVRPAATKQDIGYVHYPGTKGRK